MLWNWQIVTASSGIMDEIYLVKYSQKGSKTRNIVPITFRYLLISNEHDLLSNIFTELNGFGAGLMTRKVRAVRDRATGGSRDARPRACWAPAFRKFGEARNLVRRTMVFCMCETGRHVATPALEQVSQGLLK